MLPPLSYLKTIDTSNDIVTSDNLLGLIGVVRSSSKPGAYQDPIRHNHPMQNLPLMLEFLMIAFCTAL